MRYLSRRDWSALDPLVIAAVTKHGPNWSQVASELGIPYNTLYKRWLVLGSTDIGKAALETHQQARPRSTLNREPVKDIWDALELPVAPFPTVIPSPARASRKRYVTAVLYGDTHAGYHDQQVLDIVLGVIRDVKPDVVVHMGDLLDCYDVSDFDKDPYRLRSLQDEINAARTHLEQVAQIAPEAQRYLLEGNHEDRLRRQIWRLQSAAAAIAKLDKVRKVLNWPYLLDLDVIGFEWVPAQGQARFPILPKAITKHGTIVRQKSAYTAKAEMDKYGKSGFSGHTHRLGTHWHSDANGAHFWVETGCTCVLKPEYCEDPDWQNGCYVVTFDSETGAPAIEQVYIANGNTQWRGQTYEAEAA